MKYTCSLIIALLFFTLAAPYAVMSQTPVMCWDFETIRNRTVIEESTKIADTIEGNFESAAGVAGKGLRLDGFTTRVIRTGKNTRKPGAAFTLEAWVALGEYPLNWCPVITTESDEVKGYRLLIGPYGQVSFETAIGEQWMACTSANEAMPLRNMWVRWIAGGYNHFPVNQAGSDGRWAKTTDRPTHSISHLYSLHPASPLFPGTGQSLHQ